MPVGAIDPRRFAAIEPGMLYPVPDLAALFGVDPSTARAWVRANRIPSEPHPVTRHRLVRGAVILGLVADLIRATAPAEVETEAQRLKRAGQDWDALKRIAKGKG